MTKCPGCGGIVGEDCWNPQECEWISRDMAARHAAQAEVEPLLQRIAELEDRIRELDARPRKNVDPDPFNIGDTCCGKCPGGTCYVDQMTGA